MTITSGRGRPRSFDRSVALNKVVLLFWKRGYEGTSIRDLTQELGISPPSLYSAFGDNRRLFLEALAVYDAQYGAFIDQALREEPTARQAADRVFDEGPRRYTRTGLPAGCLIASGDSGSADAEIVRGLVAVRRSKVAAFTKKIQGDIDGGTLPADTDAASLATYTMGVVAGLAQAAKDGVARSRLHKTGEIAMRAWPR